MRYLEKNLEIIMEKYVTYRSESIKKYEEISENIFLQKREISRLILIG